MVQEIREFTAVVWMKNSTEPGRHEVLWAESREQARALLEEKYGPDIAVSLVDKVAASRPRG